MPAAALDLKEAIPALKKERTAVILARNYQTGDLGRLGRRLYARETDAEAEATFSLLM